MLSKNWLRRSGVVVAKRRAVVTFGFALGLRVSNVSTVTGIAGSWSRNADLLSFLDLRLVFAFQKCQQSRGPGGPGRETQSGRHFWTCVWSSRFKSVNSHGDWGGSWSRNAERSSFLDLRLVFAFQKCQQSQGSGGLGRETQSGRHFWTCIWSSRFKSVNSHGDRGGVLVAKRRAVVTFGLAFGLRVSRVSTVTGIGGCPGRETQSGRHFWTCIWSSRFKSVNSHGDWGGSWSRNAERSSLLDSRLVFASQTCQQSRGSGGRGRETQSGRHFWTCLWRGEKTEARREERGERREERERRG